MIKPRLNETLEDIRHALSYVDYLFPNFEEARLLTGKETLDEIADSFLDCGVKTVVIKTGKRGCFIKRADMKMEVPAVSGITAIDTIGAGIILPRDLSPRCLKASRCASARCLLTQRPQYRY